MPELIDRTQSIKLEGHQTLACQVFRENRNLRHIKPGDADDWKQFLIDNVPAEATRAKLIKRARQLLKAALRKGLVDINPFADIKAGSEIERIITRAGVEQWPRLFQNLRASRETELANQFPLHVVTY